MSTTAVVAYSGGLDTTLHPRLAEGGLVRLRRGRRRPRRRRPGVRPRGVDRARLAPPARTTSCSSTARRRSPNEQCRAGDQDERALRGQVPARLRALAPGDRRGGRGDRARARRRGRRARLHRQGQRPAPLRARLQGELPGREGDRAAARPHLDARRGDRVRARARASRSSVTQASPFSIDENLFGRSIEAGVLEDPWDAPPEEPYVLTVDPGDCAGAGGDRDRLRAGAARCRSTARSSPLAELIAHAERARRRLRDRADRHDREPRRRHQEPRGLRGARRRSR